MLEHNSPNAGRVIADVDVKLRLESLSAEQTEVGYWLNIIGYVTSITRFGPEAESSRRCGHRVGIQAIIHWPAVAVDPTKYEKDVKLQSALVAQDPLHK